MIAPRFSVFVKTQVTVSPAASEIALAGDWSLQTAEVRSQPAGNVLGDRVRAGVEIARVVLLSVREREAVGVVARAEGEELRVPVRVGLLAGR